MPESLADVLRARIAELPRPARSLLLVVAAAGDPSRDLLARADADGRLDEPIEQGVLEVLDGRVRFSHPLLASTVYGDASELERNRVHARLAELVDSPEERAWHLALAGTGPDAPVAAALEQAAEATCRRGACAAGAALYERAADLTPAPDEDARSGRLIAAANAHFQAGEPERARTLLEGVAAGGSAKRFEALCRLGLLLDETVGGDEALAAFEAALGTDDPTLAVSAYRGLAQTEAFVGNLERALRHADAAVVGAEPIEDRRVLVYALATQAWVRKLAGHPGWQEPLERGLDLEREVEIVELDLCASAIAAETRRLVLQIDDARAAYLTMFERATERGDVRTESWCRFGLAWIEIAAGSWAAAAEHAQELMDFAEQTSLLRLPAIRISAHLAILEGDVERARSLLAEVLTEAEEMGERFNLRAALQLEGLLELSLGDLRAAIPPLRRAREIADDMGVGEPALLMFFLDEAEALAGSEDPVAAGRVLATFEKRCEGHDTPWATPLVLRGRGLILAAEHDLDAARQALEAAVAAEAELPLPLERARTRLLLGRVLRRAKQRTASQTMLAEALAMFEELGAPLWAERVREELGRIGGRAPSRDELTPTERRIAELAAAGMTNREVAATLFVTPKTVESALTRIYRKLGVRSRTELARRLGAED